VLETLDLESGRGCLDDKAAETAMAVRLIVRDGEDRDEIRHAAVADEPLGPVDHVVVAVATGRRPHRGGVRARLGLRDGERDEARAGRELGQPAAFLVLRAGDEDRQRPELLDRQDQPARCAHATDLLDRETDGEQLAAHPAVGLGERQPEDVV
jgi:hypothetical protein